MLNRIVLVGRLTRDPETRTTSNGTVVSSFTLAVNRNYKNAQGEAEADFIPVVTWRKLAELCSKYLKKGKLAAVDGRLETRTYDDKEGVRRYISEVIADNVVFLSPKDNTENTENADTYAEEFPIDKIPF